MKDLRRNKGSNTGRSRNFDQFRKTTKFRETGGEDEVEEREVDLFQETKNPEYTNPGGPIRSYTRDKTSGIGINVDVSVKVVHCIGFQNP